MQEKLHLVFVTTDHVFFQHSVTVTGVCELMLTLYKTFSLNFNSLALRIITLSLD